MTSCKNKGIATALCLSTPGAQTPQAMAAIATFAAAEIHRVIHMDSVPFSARRMHLALTAEQTGEA